MHSSAKGPTKAEKRRMSRFPDIGCVACYVLGVKHINCGPVEAHHLTDCGRRIGHEATVPLGIYHHRGVRPENVTKAEMFRYFGPNLADDGRQFRECFGTDDFLLDLTNKLLGYPDGTTTDTEGSSREAQSGREVTTAARSRHSPVTTRR
jgi:hypothetical protein